MHRFIRKTCGHRTHLLGSRHTCFSGWCGACGPNPAVCGSMVLAHTNTHTTLSIIRKYAPHTVIYLRWWFDTERVCAACNACTFRTIMRSARAFIQRPRRLPGRTRACENVRACMCDMLRDHERSELVSTYNSYYDCWRERDHACESASTVRRLDKSNSQTVQNYLNVLRVRREPPTMLQQSATCATFYARRHTHTHTHAPCENKQNCAYIQCVHDVWGSVRGLLCKTPTTYTNSTSVNAV